MATDSPQEAHGYPVGLSNRAQDSVAAASFGLQQQGIETESTLSLDQGVCSAGSAERGSAGSGSR